jgi:hypothetical protein
VKQLQVPIFKGLILKVGDCSVEDPVLRLQLLLDSALDCLYLIIQTKLVMLVHTHFLFFLVAL